MHIPSTIIKGHSNIFTSPLDRFLRGILRISGATGIVPTDCNRPEASTQSESLNPNAIQTIVREPMACEPPPSVRLAYEGLQSGCTSSKLSPCFPGEMFRFHLEEIDNESPYRAKECEAIQWDFADHLPVEFGDSVEHLFPANIGLAAVEIKSSAANQWLPFDVAPRFVSDSIEPNISYHGEDSGCSDRGPACWRGEPIRFEANNSVDVEATWLFDGEYKHGTPIMHTFTTVGMHEVHLGIVRDQRGGEATATIPVEPHCFSLGNKASIQYHGERSGCSVVDANCMATEVISFSLAGLPVGADDNCFSVEWSYGDGGTGNGRNSSHTYKAAKTVAVSASITSSGATTTSVAQLTLTCPPLLPVSLDYSGESSGCSRASVSSGTRLCKIGEKISFSIAPVDDIAGCTDVQWSFLAPNVSAVHVEHEFQQPVPSVSVRVRSAEAEVLDIAPIRFKDGSEGIINSDPLAPSETHACPQLDRVAISYIGEKGCTTNRKCLPGERITFSIVLPEGELEECHSDEIHWLFDDGTEQHGVTASKVFRRSRPPHAVHLIVLRNGRVTTASTAVDVPLLKCRSCSGGS